jgi:ferric-dicitrate binding protein FerR (iron transport regulator)
LNQQQHIDQLLDKVRRNACTPEELQELHHWLDQQAAAGNEYEFTGTDEKEQLRLNMQRVVLQAITTPHPGRSITRTRWKKYAAAAAILLASSSVLWYFTSRPKLITIAAAPGQVVKKALPDGSTVWLNDNSELTYYSNFSRERTIVLQRGEAFFQVKKDASHPFTVQSKDVNTTVKGTSFSVKMIGDAGDIKVSVVTGRVLVHKLHDTLGLLTPGQRLRFVHQMGASRIDHVQPGEANAWIQGELFLQNAPLNEVIQWLQNHFNVKVQNSRAINTGNYYLQVKRDISLPEVISILNLLGAKDNIRFELNNETVIIH